MKALHLFSIGIILAISLIPGIVYAEQYGISLGKTCKTMLKNNISGCPNYDELDVVFPDNTDKRLGELKTIDGITQRGKPLYLHPENFYTHFSGDIIWLDPPEEVRKRIKVVTIEPSLPEYKISDSKKMNDYNITFGKDRYINSNCSEIKITAKNWLFMTGDAMNLLKHKCDISYSTFNATVMLKFEKSYQDISTSMKWKHDKWVRENLINCKVKGC